jgi:soluble cytochrome b562
MQALDELNSKLNLLLRRHAALENENKRLKETVAKQLATEASLKQRITALEQDMVSVNLNDAVRDESEKENMRKQLDGLIAEIDGLLNTLND